jgi:SAM-dependent methyltransferase
MESWLAQQAEHIGAEDWGKAIEARYPGALQQWTDPREHFRLVTEQTNYYAAAKLVNWSHYLKGDHLKVLDFGAGTGWLSLLLSRYSNIAEITALDGNRYNLETMLPAIAPLFGGDLAKIKPTVGKFFPLLAPDNHYDLIVESSAVHHAADLSECLREIHRVLKPERNAHPLARFVDKGYGALVENCKDGCSETVETRG